MHTRLSTVLAAMLAMCGIAATAQSQQEDKPNQHNMLIIGEKAAYLSHLPMFTEKTQDGQTVISPHRYQVLLDIDIIEQEKIVTDKYLKDRKENPAIKMYTIQPTELFVLPHLFMPVDRPARKSLEATVFRGHLERGGQLIDGLDGVSMRINRVIHAKHFAPSGDKPQALAYSLFGKNGEVFMAHIITRPPDFDQILAVKVTGHDFTNEELSRPITVVILDRKNEAVHRLKEGQPAQRARVEIEGRQSPIEIQVLPSVEYYFEEGELADPGDFEQTEEERKSGF